MTDQERFEVYEVHRRHVTGKGLGVTWTLVFTTGTTEGIGVGMLQQAEDAHEALQIRSSYVPPQYAVYDAELDWWLCGPPDPERRRK